MYEETIGKFSSKTILVIGDIMLDKYIYGQTTRISAEAPVPIVKLVSEKNSLGGAANVANNLASLGAKAILMGVVGKDKEGSLLKNLLKEKGIESSYVIEDIERPTTVKQRIISGNNHQMIRLDKERSTDISKDITLILNKHIGKLVKNADAIIVSDYAKGVITKILAENITKEAILHKKLLLVDTKPDKVMAFKGSSLITPNLSEASEMAGIEQDITEMGKKLVRMLHSNVFITRGAEGISVFDVSETHTYVPQMNIAKVFDVTGAGDTVIAVAALGLSSGLNLVETAKLANFAGGLVVQKPGTTTLTPEELGNICREEIKHYLSESIEVKKKVIEKQLHKIEKASRIIIEAYKRGNKVIAFGNGGSASDAQHLVGELVGRFRIERKALSAIALTTDSSVVTAIANDYGYDYVFARQIEANARKGDVVVGISTSGNSQNVVMAIKKAKEMGCHTIGLLGREGGKLAGVCDVEIVVPSNNTPRIQEAHIAIIHIICELLDKDLSKDA